MKTKSKSPEAIDIKTIRKIIENLKEGDTFIDLSGYKCHIITNLKQEGQIVFKYFGKHKQYWHYSIEGYFWFELRMRGNDRPMKIKIKKVSGYRIKEVRIPL